MVLVAHLLTENWEWERTDIRLLRVIEHEEGQEPALKDLEGILERARVKASAQVIISKDPFARIFKAYSSTVDCIFLGFESPEEGDERSWHGFYQKLLHKMPTTVLVNSQEDEILEV